MKYSTTGTPKIDNIINFNFYVSTIDYSIVETQKLKLMMLSIFGVPVVLYNRYTYETCMYINNVY